ncbi:MAG: hypothetical protein ACAI18_15205 [Gemmatimonadales bacterium]
MDEVQDDRVFCDAWGAFILTGARLRPRMHPQLEGGPTTMFICGNDPDAKATVSSLLQQFGWEPADMGTAKSARAIEPLAQLWCIPGFLHDEWRHAFRLLRG